MNATFQCLWCRAVVALLLTAAPAFAQGDSAAAAEDPAAAASDLPDDSEVAEEAPTPEEVDVEGEPYTPPSGAPEIRTLCHGKLISRIEVHGTARVAEDDVRATLRLRAGVPCTDQELRQDAEALWDQGLYDDLVFEAEPDGDESVVLTVTVTERPAIAEILFEGNDAVDDDDLEEKVTLVLGTAVSIPTIREQITKIRDHYATEGHFLARVEYELRRLDNDRNEAAVIFRIDEGPEVSVRRIRFTGNRNIPTDELLALMATGEQGFFSFLTESDTYDTRKFADDVSRLQAWYYDQGYLTMRVGSPRVELTPDRQNIDITIPITEGPRFRVGRLTVKEINADGEEVEPLEEDLARAVALDGGDFFNRTKVALGLQEITRAYRDASYAFVEVEPQMDLDEERRIVHVEIQIRRGPPVRIERIDIRGNSKTSDAVIRRELMILEGDLYSQSLTELSKRRVEALGYFEPESGVTFAEERGSADDRIRLTITIIEKATGTFQIGGGWSTIEGILLTGQVQQDNLFGHGHSLGLQLQLSSVRQLIQVNYFIPKIFDTQWNFGADVFRTVRSYLDFAQTSTGGGFTLGHPIFDPRLNFSGQYRLEHVDIGSAMVLANTGGAAARSQFQRSSIANSFRAGFTSSVRLSLTWDNRNNRNFTTDGWYANYSVELADRYLGSENVYYRHTAFTRFYKQLFSLGEGRPVVFKFNAEAGLITSPSDSGVPVFERFFLGGIFNVRGFPLYSLGPRLAVGRTPDPEGRIVAAGNGQPGGYQLGGNFQLFYQAELEFVLLPEIGIRGVLFSDGGNVWNTEGRFCGAPQIAGGDVSTDRCGVDLAGIRTSWGFGLRWFSPMGPLRFEWGFPFAPKPWEDGYKFEFTIGNSF